MRNLKFENPGGGECFFYKWPAHETLMRNLNFINEKFIACCIAA